MKNPVKKAFFLGVCASAVTKRFVEHEVKKYMGKSGISEAEGKKIVADVMRTLKKEKDSLEKTFRNEVKKGIKDAKPLVHEGVSLAKDVAAELVREARGTTRKATKRIVIKAGRSARVKLRNTTGKVRRIRRTVKLARKKMSSVGKKVKKIVKKVKR